LRPRKNSKNATAVGSSLVGIRSIISSWAIGFPIGVVFPAKPAFSSLRAFAVFVRILNALFSVAFPGGRVVGMTFLEG